MKAYVVGLVVASVAVVAGIGYYFVGFPSDPRAWTREMREAHPAQYAKLAEKTITADLEKIDGRIRELRLAAGKLSERYRDSSKKYKFGKEIAVQLVAAKQAGKFPVNILGVEYEEFQLQSQMKLVCGELKTHANTLEAVKKTSGLLEQEKLNLMLYRTSCRGQLDILRANVEIFKARQVALDGLAMLDECADVLLGVGQYLSKLDPVADIETLMKRYEDEQAGKDEGDLDLERFLNDFTDEEEAEVAVAVGKAEDFSGLEAFVDVEMKVDMKVNGKDKGEKLPTTLEGDEIPEEPAL